MKRTAAKTSKATPAARAQKPGGAASVGKPSSPPSTKVTKAPAAKAAAKPPKSAPAPASDRHKNGAPPVEVQPTPPPAAVVAEAPTTASGTQTAVGIDGVGPDLLGEDAPPVLQLVEDLASGRPTPMANAARIIEEWLGKKPEVLVPGIDRLIGCISSPHKRVAQTAALALPVMGRIAPARVARHLPALTEKFPECTEIAKDGLVATFAALCTASVAYQKRLEPVLDLALSSAEPKTLLRWAEVILPSLKGEPHARARSVVESRLPEMPRAQAQPIAGFLGIKLRPLPV